ncbi:MAG: tRNA pseudouridine(13) synthase TruD [Deltaproteobacteria bacterium]|nr:tRNA pseudouridine(13) synthase TruD [Deltaproteobacteria bacterium]
MSADPACICPLTPLDPLPRWTADLQGCGGTMRMEIDDFEVEELPAYLPSGQGDHLFLWIEKRDMAAETLRKVIARSLGVSPGDIGMAGLKDRRAITRQWVSVPRKAESALARLDDRRITVLDAVAHKNKLRTGHLRGNRFRVRLRGTQADAEALVGAKVARIADRGVPNFYGSQRMGHGGATLAAGWALAHGAQGFVRVRLPDGTDHGLDLGDRALRRLAASALQAEVFNRTLAARMAAGTFDRLIDGDICEKTDSGGQFTTDAPDRDQARLDAGAIAVTGPMWGPRMALAQRGAGDLEASVLSGCGLCLDDFAALGHLAEGTRRPLSVRVGDLQFYRDDLGLVLTFDLPAGAYATGVVGEIAGPTAASDPAIPDVAVRTAVTASAANDPCIAAPNPVGRGAARHSAQ